MDVRVNTADVPSVSSKNMVNLGPVTREFCRHVCTGRATRFFEGPCPTSNDHRTEGPLTGH